MGSHQKILITGINGFVGRAVLCELQKTGNYEIYGLVGKNMGSGFLTPELRGKIIQADIADRKILNLADHLKGTDILIHCAGLAHQFGRRARESFWEVNVHGTENICRLAQETGVRHLILVSSVAVYGGSGEKEKVETDTCRPKGFYAESKFESENRAVGICENSQLPLTILRLATAVGEGDRGNLARLITLIDKGRFIWVGDGENKKSLIYKGDAARGIRSVLRSEAAGTEIYNLTGGSVLMRDIIGEIFRNLQKRKPPLRIPERFVRLILRARGPGIFVKRLNEFEATLEKWLSNDVYSGAKFKQKFDFKPETAISEALSKQVMYYLDQKKVTL